MQRYLSESLVFGQETAPPERWPAEPPTRADAVADSQDAHARDVQLPADEDARGAEPRVVLRVDLRRR